jgi:hypothetical protein
MSENKKGKKNKNLNEKNLNEKEIEKVSGGQKIDTKFYENRPHLLAYGGPMICKYGGPNPDSWGKKKEKDNKIIFNKDEDINK